MQPLGKRRDPADSFPMLAFLRTVGPLEKVYFPRTSAAHTVHGMKEKKGLASEAL
jgi:hypothetical protein